jgi:hypothetical protein
MPNNCLKYKNIKSLLRPQKYFALLEMSTWRERLAARAAAAAESKPTRRGVRFIGNATGNTNVVRSPTRKASPHHRNRNVTRRALKAAPRTSPADSPPLRPGKKSKFVKAAIKHERATRKHRKSIYKHHKGRKPTRRHKRKYHKK